MKEHLSNAEFEKRIIKAKKSKKRTIINLGGNLFAIVRPNSSNISYTVRVKTRAKDTTNTIGSYPNMSLLQARAKALVEIKSLKKIQEAQEIKNIAPILRDAFDEWYAVKVKQYKVGSTRPKNLMTIMRTTIEPSGLADLPITEINPRTISAKLADLDQTAGNKHNAVSTISSCLQFYYLKGMLPFNPIADLLKGRESPFIYGPTIQKQQIFNIFVIRVNAFIYPAFDESIYSLAYMVFVTTFLN